MADHMLTTSDNPFSPITDFDQWRVWDEAHGYYTLSYLARVTVTSDDLSEADQAQAIDQAMNDIVSHHPGGLYVKLPVP